MSDQHTADAQGSEHEDHQQMERKQYLRFGAMIATSTVVMFLLTYTNTGIQHDAAIGSTRGVTSGGARSG